MANRERHQNLTNQFFESVTIIVVRARYYSMGVYDAQWAEIKSAREAAGLKADLA